MRDHNIHQELIVEIQKRKQHRMFLGAATVLICGIGMFFVVF